MCVCVCIYIFGKAWQLLIPCSDKCLFSYLLPLISFILFQIFSLKSKYQPWATQSFSMILQNMWIYSSSIYVLSIGFLVSFLLSTSKSNTNILPFCLPWHHLNHPRTSFCCLLIYPYHKLLSFTLSTILLLFLSINKRTLQSLKIKKPSHPS